MDRDRMGAVRAPRAGLLTMALALLLAGAAPAAEVGPALESAAAFAAKLRASGRAEASLTRRFEDPLRGGTVVMHGRLALEPPDRARIEFNETGERVTLRGDGGEWLQPQLDQMVRFGEARALGALRWWTLFGGSRASGARERQAGPRTWVITMPASGVAGDSARVELDASGLPKRIVIDEEAGTPVEYRLERWTFGRPRGRGAFVLEAPHGFEVFDLR